MHSMIAVERSIIIKANREKVWRAITQPEHFSKWFGGEIEFERLEVGAVMSFDVGGESGLATIAAVEPPKRFAFYWTPEPGDPTRTLVTFLLETVASGTQVTVTEQGFEALADKVRRSRFELNDKGWAAQMANLAAYVRGMNDA